MTVVKRQNARNRVIAKNIFFGRHTERASVSVSDIGHSDIRGLVTDRSMVRRERCRLKAWITNNMCQHSCFADRSNLKSPKLLEDAFRC